MLLRASQPLTWMDFNRDPEQKSDPTHYGRCFSILLVYVQSFRFPLAGCHWRRGTKHEGISTRTKEAYFLNCSLNLEQCSWARKNRTRSSLSEQFSWPKSRTSRSMTTPTNSKSCTKGQGYSMLTLLLSRILTKPYAAWGLAKFWLRSFSWIAWV